MENVDIRFKLRIIVTAGMNAGERHTVYNIEGLEFDNTLSREECLAQFLKNQKFIICTEQKVMKAKQYKSVLISVNNILSAEFIDE
ncbi:hypothetical protein MOO46_05480 [Apilactobacillus apisilvae]|uniref:Uncharacterized protein n=1 Tax=Apilactobacillus apisilvae TaxID=2923364 RepID=A0ABY4PGE1_9LACO|nr:hypothetical protein [Apilactobacillus apisilvae]UQS84700.1 hypothetical protein MOO46_05480 [Apilactobacillus apisilvae]